MSETEIKSIAWYVSLNISGKKSLRVTYRLFPLSLFAAKYASLSWLFMESHMRALVLVMILVTCLSGIWICK